MSDYGDFCREQREWKRLLRSFWFGCPDCGVAFGTPKLIPPGDTCPHHDWRAPGKRGDDVREARAYEKKKLREAERRKASRADRTCEICGAVMRDPKRKQQHIAKVHGGAQKSEETAMSAGEE